LIEALPGLKEIGIDNIWLPPACKASSDQGNGYDVYDLWDLGEFDQKGGKSTKWGTKEELMELSKKAKELGVGLYWDAVLNHKAAADEKETFKVVDVDQEGKNSSSISPMQKLTRLRPYKGDFRTSRHRGIHEIHLPWPKWQIQQTAIQLQPLFRC